MTPSPDTTRTAYGNEIREAPYVLIKRGLYWRPEAQGYTGVLAEAGRYTEVQVKVYREEPRLGTTVMLASEAGEFAPACWEETKIRVLKNEIAQLQAERDSLRIRLQEAEREIERLGRDPKGPGHSRAEPASGLGPTDECPSRRSLPIATAPKPFGQILLFGNLKGSAEKCWHIGKWYRGYPKGWWISSSVEVEATHWSPLPALDVETLIALGIEARRVETLGSTCESPASTEAMPEDPSAKLALLTQEESNGR